IVGGTVGMIVIGALLIVWLLWRRRRWDAATVAIAVVAVVAIGATMAAVIGRTRPEDSLAESVATSFPSGHTAVATTVVVILG
ncbi:PAP2 family protein, partial [Pseudomonas sp. BGM005]|nr:PAP2 family protein [Pseudomonas sp. BG5]